MEENIYQNEYKALRVSISSIHCICKRVFITIGFANTSLPYWRYQFFYVYILKMRLKTHLFVHAIVIYVCRLRPQNSYIPNLYGGDVLRAEMKVQRQDYLGISPVHKTNMTAWHGNFFCGNGPSERKSSATKVTTHINVHTKQAFERWILRSRWYISRRLYCP